MLGYGDWTTMIRSRGGDLVALVEPTSLSFSRLQGDVSTGSFVSPPCFPCVAIRPWEHEVHFVRSGVTEWIGTPSHTTTTTNQISIEARDLLYWLDHRLIDFDHLYTEEDLATILRSAIEAAMVRDDIGIAINDEPTGITLTRLFRRVDRRNVGEELRELASAGLNYTMHLRELIAQGPEMPTPIGPLFDHDFDDPTVEVLGTEAATEAIVLGATDAIEGVAGGVSETHGLVQTVLTGQSRILDDGAATEMARRVVDDLRIPPIQLTAKLKPDSPYELGLLLPNTSFDVRATVGCEEIEDVMRLTNVNVERSEQESVTITLVSV